MSILHPIFLILLAPLATLFWRGNSDLKYKIHLIILILLILALIRPVIIQKEVESKVEGKNIIIAVDISFSMNANDIPPNRYQFAKETIFSFMKLNQNSNIMLIAFTTNPLLLSPPTTDHQLIRVALDSLNPKNILTKGTSLKRLFEKIGSLNIDNQELILLSDGGEESEIDTLSKILENRDISLHIVAMGKEEGSTIPLDDTTLLKDESGNLIVSRVNPILKSLAKELDGDYIESKNSPKEIAKILTKHLNSKQMMINKMEHSYLELYQIPLSLAIILFMILHTKAISYFKLGTKINKKRDII